MRKILLTLLAVIICTGACALGETARDYALWLEAALPGA